MPRFCTGVVSPTDLKVGVGPVLEGERERARSRMRISTIDKLV